MEKEIFINYFRRGSNAKWLSCNLGSIPVDRNICNITARGPQQQLPYFAADTDDITTICGNSLFICGNNPIKPTWVKHHRTCGFAERRRCQHLQCRIKLFIRSEERRVGKECECGLVTKDVQSGYTE